MTDPREAHDSITGDSWLDDLARASLSALDEDDVYGDGIHTRVTSYDVSVWPEVDADCPNARHWKLTVERQQNGRWAVMQGPYLLDADGVVDYGRSGYPDDERFSFPLAEALALARKYAPQVTINSLTATEALARHRERSPGGCDA